MMRVYERLVGYKVERKRSKILLWIFSSKRDAFLVRPSKIAYFLFLAYRLPCSRSFRTRTRTS